MFTKPSLYDRFFFLAMKSSDTIQSLQPYICDSMVCWRGLWGKYLMASISLNKLQHIRNKLTFPSPGMYYYSLGGVLQLNSDMEYFHKYCISINFKSLQPKGETNPNQKSQLDDTIGNTLECFLKAVIKMNTLVHSPQARIFVSFDFIMMISKKTNYFTNHRYGMTIASHRNRSACISCRLSSSSVLKHTTPLLPPELYIQL